MKTTIGQIAKATALILLATAIAAYGQQAETMEVTADGYGSTPGQADKDALRAAVKKAVGTFVDSETLIDKEEVVKDEILTHSDGFVEKVLDAGKAEQVSDNIWKVTKKVLVRKGKLVAKLERGGVVTAEMDGEDIWAQEISKIQNVNDGRALLKKFLQENTMNKLLVARQVDAQGNASDQAGPVVETNYNTGKTTLTFHIQVRYNLEVYYKQYAPQLIKLLDQIMVVENESYPMDFMHVHEEEVSSVFRDHRLQGSPIKGLGKCFRPVKTLFAPSRFEEENTVSLLNINISRDKKGKNMRYKVYRFPEDGGKYYVEDLLHSWGPKSSGRYLPHPTLPKLQIFFRDKSGAILGKLESSPAPWRGDAYADGLSYLHARYHSSLESTRRHLLPDSPQMFLCSLGNNPNFLFEPRFAVPYFRNYLISYMLTDSLSYTYAIEMDADDTKNLGSIDMRFP